MRSSRVRAVRSCATHAAAVLAICAAVPAPVSAAPEDPEITHLKERIGDLNQRIDDADRILTPVAILVGILAAGGALGIVFSFRDQRRASQLHELTVTGELASQRRTEENYTSFFEASQKTLNLVNETLGLAREATDQATHNMQRSAQRELDQIERKAQNLLRPIFSGREFELVLSVPRHRIELERIGDELNRLGAYFLLEGIRIGPFSQFVKALDDYLDGKTRDAHDGLHAAARAASAGELRRFSLYWAGSLERNLGHYDRAIDTFATAHRELEEFDDERFELDRIIAETEFFAIAARRTSASARDRYRAVAELLERLRKTAEDASQPRTDRPTKRGPIHEIAATRGHLYAWIAYDGNRLNAPLPRRENDDRQGPRADDNSIREWAVREARRIYHKVVGELNLDEGQEGADFDIEFGKAECDFKLALCDVDPNTAPKQNPFETVGLSDTLDQVERLAHDDPTSHREPRKAAEFAQTMLICKCRRLAALPGDPGIARELERAYNDARAAVRELPDHEIQLFSQLQRRNLTHEAFHKELERLHTQATGREDGDGG